MICKLVFDGWLVICEVDWDWEDILGDGNMGI